MNTDNTRYHFGYAEGTPYGHAMALLTANLNPGDLVLDLGCGFGSIAEPLRDAGFAYVGTDVGEAGVTSLRERGFDAYVADISELEEVRSLIAGHDVAAITMLDVLEHLDDPLVFLERLRGLFAEEIPALVLSVPNVAHFDVGAKLLSGRWDTSPTGLLDETHLSWFTDCRLTAVLEQAGFSEIARNDFSLHTSDQGHPWDLPVLGATTLSRLLREVREAADGFGYVNQFVRLYRANAAPRQGEQTQGQAAGDDGFPFLSVILRTQGTRRHMLSEALLCLAAQEDQDFEVVLVVHTDDSPVVAEVAPVVAGFPPQFAERVTTVAVSGGGRSTPLNAGLAACRGSYIAFLDDDDLVTADWVSSFRSRVALAPGQVIRSVTVTQEIEAAQTGAYRAVGRMTYSYPSEFDPVSHVHANSTPICSFAVSKDFIDATRAQFSESLRVLEDWDFLMAAVNWCGVSDTHHVTSVYHQWRGGAASSASEPTEIWESSRRAVQSHMDARPLLLPPGSASALADVVARAGQERQEYVTALEKEVARLQGEVGEQFQEIARLQLIATSRGGLRSLIRAAMRMARRTRRRGERSAGRS